MDLLQKIMIPKVVAPTITPQICSGSFYELNEELANNKFQKFILEGKWKEKWGNLLPNYQ